MSRPKLAVVGTLLVLSCALAAFLVLGSTDNPQALSAYSAAEVSQEKPITGTLSKPAYTVIALDSAGSARTARTAADGSFTLTPTAEAVSLHLRAPDGTYAGPITIAESEAAITERELKVSKSKTKVKDSEAKVRRAKKQVKRATKKVKKAKRKLRKASGNQATRKARKKLKQAKRKLRQAKQKLRLAKKKLSKATAQLRAARSELQAARERQTGERAILGVRSASALGSIQVDSSASFAKAEASTVGQWERWADTKRWAQASSGVPIGAGNFGRVRSSQLSGSGVGDLDRDGVFDPLDIDDDGDLVLDKFEAAAVSTSGAVTSAFASGDFPVSPEFQVGLFQVVNANMEGATNAELDNLLPSSGHLIIRFANPELAPEGSPEADIESIELDCGQPQDSADPGLVYCTTGGTGRFSNHDVDPAEHAPFPDCCDADGDGAGSLYPNPYASEPFKGSPTHIWLFHHANSDQIKSGDLLIQRVTQTDGTEYSLVSTIQYVFVTTPALISFDDRQGNSVTIDYPVAWPSGPGTIDNPFPVKAGPDGDVVLDLTFWRPQRKPIPPETEEWIDIGGLDYSAGGFTTETGLFTCDQDAYSTTDANLEPIPGQIPYGFGGGFRDKATDQPASPDNTFSYQLNLTQCLESKGLSLENGEVAGVQFNTFTPPTGGTVSDVDTDHAGFAVHFKREE